MQGGSTDYEADVSQAGIEEESSFSQDPLALAETDPLASSGSEEKKPVSGARRPGIHLNIPPAFWIIVGRCCGGGYHWFGTSYGEIPD